MKHEYNLNLNPLDIDSYLIFLATFFLKFYYLNKMFLVVLDLCGCSWTFSSCSKRGAPFCCGAWASHCGGFSCCGARLMGSWASVVAAHGLQSVGSIIFMCTGLVGLGMWDLPWPCPLHWQADSYPLYHQGSPILKF